MEYSLSRLSDASMSGVQEGGRGSSRYLAIAPSYTGSWAAEPGHVTRSIPAATPLTRGASSRTQDASMRESTRDIMKPFLEEDTKAVEKCSMEEFLHEILKTSGSAPLLPHEALQHASSKEMEALFDTYCRVVGEKGRYEPFVDLGNAIFSFFNDKAPTAPNLLFKRNDPNYVLGSVARRKPDIVIVNRRAVETGMGKKTQTSSSPRKGSGRASDRSRREETAVHGKAAKPTERGLHWQDVASWIEFKARGVPERDTLPTERDVAKSQEEEETSSFADIENIAPVPKPEIPPPRTTHSAMRSPNSSRRNNTGVSFKRPREGESLLAENKKPQKRQKHAPKHRPSLRIQNASYSLELLSHGGFRSHIIAAMVVDGFLALLYYDRSTLIESEWVPFTKKGDRINLYKALHALYHLDAEKLGFHGLFKNTPLSLDLPDGSLAQNEAWFYQGTIIEVGEVGRGYEAGQIRIDKEIYHQHGLIGRGTHVLEATVIKFPTFEGAVLPEWENITTVVVKLSWIPKSRTPEHDFIKAARDAAQKEHEWAKNHLPLLLWTTDKASPGQPIEYLKEKYGDRYEERVLRLSVFEKLQPLASISGVYVFLNVIRQIYACGYWLMTVAKIFHGDISIHNIMIRERDGQKYGVLNDLDLARFLNQSGPLSKQRTGTLPFMAMDLHNADYVEPGANNPLHLHRHQSESLFYVLLWRCFCEIQDGKLVMPENHPLHEWRLHTHTNMYRVKVAMLSTKMPPLPDAFRPIKDLLLGAPVVCSLRTIKSDVVVGLGDSGDELSEKLDKEEPGWKISGKYAVVLLSEGRPGEKVHFT